MALPVRDEHNGVGTLTPRPSRQLIGSVCGGNASLARTFGCRTAADALDRIVVLSWLWCSAGKS